MARARRIPARLHESRLDGRSEPAPADVAARLEPWFRAHARDLPWRRTRDPYAIWVSEVMLQQTRVETVERYYETFLRRFPSVEALAAADEESVLGAWSGLGYYRRAKLLHRGARHVNEQLCAALPETAAELRTVPGIGRYTAGAVASIAFDRPEPLVDGNVARVSSRLRAVVDPKLQDAAAEAHWSFVRAVLEHGTPRVLSQALMELGATVCTPRKPRCETCPLADVCLARATEKTEIIPAPKKRSEQPLSHRAALALIVETKHKPELMLVRREGQGLLANMWCLPLVTLEAAPVLEVPTQSLSLAVGRKLPFEAKFTGHVRHVFTHRIWELYPVRAALPKKVRLQSSPGVDPWSDTCWIAPGERPPGGMPSVTEKLLAVLGF